MNITFEHNANTIGEAINLNNDDLLYTKKALIFSVLSPRVLVDKLYDNSDDAPLNMSTVSGRLELGLSLLKSDEMKLFYLLNFNDIYEKLVEMYVIYKNPEKIEEVFKDKGEDSDGLTIAIKNLMLQVKLKPIKDLIDYIEQSNGDFNTFVNLSGNFDIPTESE